MVETALLRATHPASARPLRPLILGSYSRGFWLMCLWSFLFFLSCNLLLPELPQHLADLGGADYKGPLIIRCSALSLGADIIALRLIG